MGAERGTRGNVSDTEDDDDLDEEPGEVIQSAPPLEVGQKRELGNSGVKKKIIKCGRGWETPEFGDEVTVHYVGTLLDGTKFDSTREQDGPLTFKLGRGEVVTGLDDGIITMKRGECAVSTLPPQLAFGVEGGNRVPPDAIVQFEVELLSWITVVDVCKDGGIIKKIMKKEERNEQPSNLDEVLDALGEEGRDNSNRIHEVPSNSVLNIDLELVSFRPVIDVTGDSKVIKKILKEGEGSVVANDGATVTIRYTAKLEDGTVFEKKGVDGEQPLQFVTDDNVHP